MLNVQKVMQRCHDGCECTDAFYNDDIQKFGIIEEIECPKHVNEGELGRGEFFGDTSSNNQVHRINHLEYQLKIMKCRIESLELGNRMLIDDLKTQRVNSNFNLKPSLTLPQIEIEPFDGDPKQRLGL